MTEKNDLLQPTTAPKQYGHLFSEIDKGEIKIPNFQRDFVWTKEQTAKLIDSIIRGYPIGAFILWKTKERLRHIKNIGNFKLPEPDKTDYIYYVLDGQQRITSLYAMKAGVIYKNENGITINYKDIFINLDVETDSEEDIVVIDKENENCISVFDVLNQRLAILFDRYTNFREKIELYKSKLEGYNFSTITLPEYPMDIACDVFTRLNTGGTELSLFEIMVAKTYDEKTEFDLSTKFLELVRSTSGEKSLYDSGFDTIGSIVTIQIISAILNKEVRRRDILKTNKDKFIESWDIMKESLFCCVDFVRSKIGVPVSQLLPYPAILVPISYFFAKNKCKVPDNNQAKLLKQYFYWAALTWRYSSAAEGKIALDIKKMEKILKGQMPHYGNEMTSILDMDIRKTTFSAGNAYCKAILCLFASMKPRTFNTDSETILDNSYLRRANSRNYHHFFPQSHLANQGFASEDINCIANITLVDDSLNKYEIRAKAPKKYISRFSKENDNIGDTLKSHLIGYSGFGICEDDYEHFLMERSKLIAKKLNVFLEYKPKN